MGMSDHQGYKKPPHGGGGHDLPRDWESPEDAPLVEVVDKLIAATREGDPTRFELFRLRQRIEENEMTLQEARSAIEKMDEVIKKVTSPANRIGTFLGLPKKDL